MSNKLDKSGFKITRSLLLLPVTALASTYLESLADSNSSHKSILVFIGSGGYISLNSISNSKLCMSIQLFENHSIHGIRILKVDSKTKIIQLLVWGDKSIVFVTYSSVDGGDSNGDGINIRLQEKCSSYWDITRRHENLDDLILDCNVVKDQSSDVLIVGYAHNFVDIVSLELENYTKIFRVQCSAMSVLFSMAFYGSSISTLTIASGTAFGDIYLWNIQFTINNLSTSYSSTITNKLKVHEGVIFKVKWSLDGKYIASVSDDRTVRLWNILDNDNDDNNNYNHNKPYEVFKGWGHISRVWDVVFLRIDSILYLASSSEDGTIKLWDDQGNCKLTLRGHEGSIWCIDSCENSKYIISVGNDASIKVWDVKYHMTTSAENLTYSGITVEIRTEIKPVLTKIVDEQMPVIFHHDNIHEKSNNKINRLNESNRLQNPVVDTINDDNNDDNKNDDDDDDDHLILEIPKKSSKSRRLNGVCNVFVEPSSDKAVIVLSEGTIWSLTLSSLYSIIPSNSNSTSSSDSYPSSNWHHLITTSKPIVNADIKFNYPDDIHMIIAHYDGTVSVIVIDVTSKGSFHVRSNISFQAHEVRAVNVWLHLINESIDNEYILITASVNGSCRLWKRRSMNHSNLIEYELIYDMYTSRNEIVTSCFIMLDSFPVHFMDSNNTSHSNNKSNTLSENFNLQYMFLGDSRGGISIYLVNLSQSFIFYHDSISKPIYPIAYLHRQHGSDPITKIYSFSNEIILTTGLNGYLNTYRFIYPIGNLNKFLDSLTSTSEDNISFEKVLDNFYRKKTIAGKVTASQNYPFNPIKLISRQSTLPIKSPDFISIENSIESISLFKHDLSRLPSIYIGGYVGSQYIVLDILKKYELLRIEGGGWKRPHTCDIQYNGHLPYSYHPRIIYLCPIPQDKNTMINIVDSNQFLSYSNHEIDLDHVCSLPLHLGSHGHGKVNYAGAMITINHSIESFVLVGGELGSIYVYNTENFMFPNIILPERSPVQQLSMPSNVCVKTISVGTNRMNPKQGIVIAAGGKLRYSIWSYTFCSNSLRPYSIQHPSDHILCYQVDGTLWPQATQDHRTLSSDIIWLENSMGGRYTKSNGSKEMDSYFIVLGDSRGIVSIGICSRMINSIQTHSNYDDDDSDHNYQYQFDLKSQFSIEEYPILCCKLLHISSSNIIGIFGDTTGCVYIYQLTNEKSRKILSFEAHSIGCNSLDATLVLDSINDNMNDDISHLNQGENRTFRLIITSGGDDQSITIFIGKLSIDMDVDTTMKMMIQVQDIERVMDTSGSAIKGVKLLQVINSSHSNIDLPISSLFLTAVGYDQRLNIWLLGRMDTSTDLNRNDYLKPIKSQLNKADYNYGDDINCYQVQSVQRKTSKRLKWIFGLITYISDVNALSINNSILSHQSSSFSLSPNNGNNTENIQLMVVGEGFELLTVHLPVPE